MVENVKHIENGALGAGRALDRKAVEKAMGLWKHCGSCPRGGKTTKESDIGTDRTPGWNWTSVCSTLR